MKTFKNVLRIVLLPVWLALFIVFFVVAALSRCLGFVFAMLSLPFDFVWDVFVLFMKGFVLGLQKKKPTDVIASVSSERTRPS